MERVVIFIDGSNFYYGLKSVYGDSKEFSDFNFRKLGDILIEDRKLIRIFYYNASLDFKEGQERYWKQQRFFERLKNTEKLRLVLSKLQKRRIKGTEEYYHRIKGDDVNLASEMIKGAYEGIFDTAILISGDGDFVPAVNIVQDKGKEVENIYFRNSLSWHLKQTCDKSIKLTKEILDKCFD